MIIKKDAFASQAAEFPTWQEHYDRHVNPTLMTSLLRRSVPVLDQVSWRVLEVAEGSATTILPLGRESTNQHGTHQAALIALSADYTGGLALATLLTGVPLAGIHRCNEEESASLWLADMSVRFRAPSTGHMIGNCTIDGDMADKIQKRYFSGKKVFVMLPISFHSNGELVAEAEMKYFAQPSVQLRPNKDSKLSPIFATKLKASARMIAGVRAQTPKFQNIRIDCPHTKNAATEHGTLLANQLRSALPELTDMVHARTQHGDNALMKIPELEQVVIVGAGLDMRPYRWHQSLPNVTWFELDLPVMLEERQRVISELDNPPAVQRRPIGLDLLENEVHELLLEHPDFDPEKPSLVIYEGCSMYFEAKENRRILRSIRRLLQNPNSRVWCDMVTEEVIKGKGRFPQVDAFLKAMDNLGERFIFGSSSPAEYLSTCGYDQAEVTPTSKFLGIEDAVLDLYNFVIAR